MRKYSLITEEKKKNKNKTERKVQEKKRIGYIGKKEALRKYSLITVRVEEKGKIEKMMRGKLMIKKKTIGNMLRKSFTNILNGHC